MAEGFAAAGFTEVEDGILPGMEFENYLMTGWRPPGAADDAPLASRASKSTLIVAAQRSPKHAITEKEESNAMKLGTALHTAVLEPDFLTERFKRGPDDRRGNKWKDFVDEVGASAALTSGEYDDAVIVRDVLRHEPLVKRLTGQNTLREVSCFWTDPATGVKCRARPDAFVGDLNMVVDLKTTEDARLDSFYPIARRLGYFAQEALYSEGWEIARGRLDAFVFLVLEKSAPFDFKIYEWGPDDIAEGQQLMRRALDVWARCIETGQWPGYKKDVERLALRRHDFKETQPQEISA